jgi:cystathionine beta-lyase/cystathionine gamma-synthase
MPPTQFVQQQPPAYQHTLYQIQKIQDTAQAQQKTVDYEKSMRQALSSEVRGLQKTIQDLQKTIEQL